MRFWWSLWNWNIKKQIWHNFRRYQQQKTTECLCWLSTTQLKFRALANLSIRWLIWARETCAVCTRPLIPLLVPDHCTRNQITQLLHARNNSETIELGIRTPCIFPTSEHFSCCCSLHRSITHAFYYVTLCRCYKAAVQNNNIAVQRVR